MSVVESINNTTNKAVRVGEDYLKTSQEYYTLKAFQQLAYSFSLLCKMLIVGSLALLGIIFLMIFLGEYIGNMSTGWLIVGGVLIALGFLIYIFRKYIDRTIIRKMSQNFFD